MEYSYKPTTHGRAVMAACMALERPFHITRVAFGSGLVDEETNLADVHQLFAYVSDGAVTERRHENDRFYLTIQFANQQHQEVKTFLLSEFIVYVEDPVTGEETDLLYGTMGDYRQPVPAYNPAYPPSVFNFPLTLILSDEINVAVSAPAGLVTFDDLMNAKADILRDIMMGETTLPLSTAGGEVLLTDGGTPVQAVYKIESVGNIMSAVARQINEVKQEVISAAASDAEAKVNAAKQEVISTAASDAEVKANAAKQEAISAAASDAQAKVSTASSGLTEEISAQIAAHNKASTAHPTHLAVVIKS